MPARSSSPERFSFADFDETLPIARPDRRPARQLPVVPAARPRRRVRGHQPDHRLLRTARAPARVRPRGPGPSSGPEVHRRGVPREVDDVLRADLRARAVPQREHRRDQGADGLHGRLPDDDRPRHVHHQRHRARRRQPARPLARASSSSRARTRRRSSPARSTRTAASGSRSTSRPSPRRTSTPAPASRASAASRCSRCCARSTRCSTTRSSQRFVDHFDFLEPQWAKEQPLVPTQDAALLEIYKRARPGEVQTVEAARQYFEGAFFSDKRYDLTRVGRYKLDRKLGPEIEKIEGLFGVPLERPGPRPGHARARRGAGDRDLPAAPRQAHERRGVDLPHRRPGPLREPAHPLGGRAHPEPDPRRALAHGARRPRADEHPGRRGDHAPVAHQHPPRRRRGQGVLRDQPAQPVHGPEQPAVGPHPQAPALRARAGRPLA